VSRLGASDGVYAILCGTPELYVSEEVTSASSSLLLVLRLQLGGLK
jgi:hypothetical protein